MTATAMKKKVIDVITKMKSDDQLLKVIFNMINNNTNTDVDISEEDVKDLHNRRKKYLAGKATVYTADEVYKKALKNLQK